MVLKIAHAAATSVLAPGYYTPVIVAALAVYALYTYSQGRKTSRERDLHGRTVILTGAFTPIGLTLLDALAKRGAHIIALSDAPIDSGAPHVLVPLLRDKHANEQIFAEHADLRSPASIRRFTDALAKAESARIDAVVFAHEYGALDSPFAPRARAQADAARAAAGCATFMLTTLLMPLLLSAPAERDIRLITLVNPFYAAAAPRFSAAPAPATARREGVLAAEGRRALRAAVLARHLQRVLDALPAHRPAPPTDAHAASVSVVSERAQKSNIVAVTVSPGVSRSDIVAPLLGADRSWRGLALYVLLSPLIRVLAKSPAAAIESVLHTLFLPTPFKLAMSDAATEGTPEERTAVEVLKPGALYAECALVPLRVPPAPPPPETDGQEKEQGAGKEMADDGELGGVALGTAVWEEAERALKAWEKDEAEEVRRRERVESEERVSRPATPATRPSTPPTVDA